MPRKPIGCDVLEMAARHLAGWCGNGQTWFAEWDEVKSAGPDADHESAHGGDALSIRWRGRVVEKGEKGWLRKLELEAAPKKGAGRVRQLHGWGRHGTKVAIPSHRPCRDAAGALSFAKLPGPLAPLLLLYACEDANQWPTVERFALACYPHPEAVRDAMRRILWGSRGVGSPPPQDCRAREIGVRAATFRQRTRRAEAMLRDWLDRAAWGFLMALNDEPENGTAGRPEDRKSIRGGAISTAEECSA
jgi:hypothetical protein